MNNNSQKSVSTSANKSKGRKSKKKTRKNTVEFVAIPIQDLAWAKEQKPSVWKLWAECWECDPYGSRWMVLNHSLSDAAFFKAKKLLTEKGLFIFKSERSWRNGRERMYWMVWNLHGARQKNFGLNLDSSDRKSNSSRRESNSSRRESHSSRRESIEPQTTQNQVFQKPSITSHQRLTNTSKVLDETGEIETKGENFDASPTSEGGLASVSFSQDGLEKTQPTRNQKEEKVKTNSNQELQESTHKNNNSEPGELNKKSTEEYIFNPYVPYQTKSTIEQNLAIEEQKNSEEYQNTSKDAFAQIRAKLEGKAKERQNDRFRRLKTRINADIKD